MSNYSRDSWWELGRMGLLSNIYPSTESNIAAAQGRKNLRRPTYDVDQESVGVVESVLGVGPVELAHHVQVENAHFT